MASKIWSFNSPSDLTGNAGSPTGFHMVEEKRPVGRPSEADLATVQKICDLVSNGHSLVRVTSGEYDTEDFAFPRYPTVARWIEKSGEFRSMLMRARASQAEFYAQQIMDIADDKSGDTLTDSEGRTVVNHAAVQRNRLMIDTRKWIVGKLLPKIYGDTPGGLTIVNNVLVMNEERRSELIEQRKRVAARLGDRVPQLKDAAPPDPPMEDIL